MGILDTSTSNNPHRRSYSKLPLQRLKESHVIDKKLANRTNRVKLGYPIIICQCTDHLVVGLYLQGIQGWIQERTDWPLRVS